MHRTFLDLWQGGQVHKFSAIVACGNFNGVVGYGKGKGTAVPVALQRVSYSFLQLIHFRNIAQSLIAETLKCFDHSAVALF